ncbi:iron complex transport system substrate-binding protein [Chromohalobacter marismortui]|uniref:Iron complex transport system substrate-binding protein n=1 Tax=Chromohalobacter marismortui TaxID=42055 RepID=A0A4R7NUV5_9GAMM|nr:MULTISPECIES: cobalamin-binding protein [Chromohalobacter]MCI0510490.1 cobalamin-binding protein [Chromohalobacter sp.]MCI0594157.1 cobalamin-binding protein [Chromohalobacter sp.]TDU24934.1 iron complex transport system substrate-binding protein [Chromohalobacter marismortui]
MRRIDAFLTHLLVLVTLLSSDLALAAIEVTDDAGNKITLDSPAERVVALAPHIVEMLYAVEAGERLVGVLQGSDFPPAARDIPRVGSYRGIALEAIMAREPDLVVTWRSGTPRSVVERLAALGVPVYESEPRRLDDVANDLRDLGRLTGHAKAGARAAEAFESRLAASRQTLSETPRVFYQLGRTPLTTLGDGHIITQAIRHCGGTPLFAERSVLVPEIGREALIEARPEVILSASRSDDWQHTWQGHDWLPAVRNGHLYTLAPDLISRPGPRLVEGIAQVCQALERASQPPEQDTQ